MHWRLDSDELSSLESDVGLDEPSTFDFGDVLSAESPKTRPGDW